MEAELIPKDKSDIFGGSLSLFLTLFPCPTLHHSEAAACSTPYMLDMLLLHACFQIHEKLWPWGLSATCSEN